jgi:hypothetical protein
MARWGVGVKAAGIPLPSTLTNQWVQSILPRFVAELQSLGYRPS